MAVAVMIVRVRVMHVAIMVAVLGITSVGMIVHAVHPLYFTHLRRLVQAFRVDCVVISIGSSLATASRALHNIESKGAQAGVPVLPVGSLTRPRSEFIDAFPCGCQHRTSFRSRL